MTYIALLGGINVGGHTVKMERLRQLFAQLGFANVRSYIQTGNVFFETDHHDRSVLTQIIVALNPFAQLQVTADMRMFVVFLGEPPPAELVFPLRAPKDDLELIATTRGEAFTVWYLNKGRPLSSASDKWLVRTLGTRKATTRFFHTAAKILHAAKSS